MKLKNNFILFRTGYELNEYTDDADDKCLHNKKFARSVVYLGYLSIILRVPQYDTETTSV